MKTKNEPYGCCRTALIKPFLRVKESNLFYADRSFFVANAPFLGGGADGIEYERIAEGLAHDVCGILFHDIAKSLACGNVNADSVEDFEAGILTHGLNLSPTTV